MYNEENYDNYEDEDSEEEQSSGGRLREIYENNKKLIWVLGIIIALIIIAAIFNGIGGSSGGENSVVGPVNRPERIQVSRAKEIKMKVRGQEYTGSYGVFSWISRNPNIAEIDNSGIITGKSIGKTVINGIYTENNNSYSFTVDVVVFNGNENVKLQNIDFNDRSLVINNIVHEYSINDKLRVVPDDGYVYDIKYSSSNPSIVSVDESGLVQGISYGKATITASVNDGSKEALLDVYVKENVVDPKLIKIPQKIEFEDGTSLKLELNASKELKLAPSPSDADSEFITWKSSDANTVAVTDDGMISGVKIGTATITATALNGKEGKIVVEVVQNTVPIDSISIIPSSITMKSGESRTLLPTIKPDNASNKSLIFESSNTAVASVVPTSSKTSATIYANNSGSAVITVKSDNGKIATLTVTVSGTSSGSNPTSSGSTTGSGSGSGSITVRLSNSDVSDKKPNKECNGLIDYYNGPLTVTITRSGDVASIAYCYTKGCTPSNKQSFGSNNAITFTIPSGGTYILKVRKYNSSGSEIASSNSNNYEDGSLVYYINTKQSGLSCTSKSSWESGGSTSTSKGACYVNTTLHGVSNSFVWKEEGSSLGSYTNLAETVIKTKADCERAANNNNGNRNLCFRNGNKYYYGSHFSVKNAYPNNVYVSNIITEEACTGTSGTGNKLTNISFEIEGGGSNVAVEVGKTKDVKINLNPSMVNENVVIKKECQNGGDFTVDKSTIKSSDTIKITGKTVGNCVLKVIGDNGNGISKTLSVQVWSIDNIPLDGGQSA